MPVFGLFGPPDVKDLVAKRNIQGLIQALKYKGENRVREKAASALGQIGDVRAIEPLITALNDGEWYVRGAAAEALGRIRDTRAVEPLIAALKDKEIRMAATDALGRIGDARAVEPLIAVLKDPSNPNYARVHVLAALGAVAEPRAVEAMVAALNDNAIDVRKAAADALEKSKWQPSSDLERAYFLVAQQKWDELLILGKTAVEPLRLVIEAQGPGMDAVRIRALSVLGKLGDPHAIEPLQTALNDTNPGARSVAAETLGKVGVIEPLVAALENTSNPGFREELQAILRQVGKGAVEPLVLALNDKNNQMRTEVAQVLGHIGNARATEALIAALKDNDKYVRRTAANELEKLGWRPSGDVERAYLLSAQWKWAELAQLGQAAVEPLVALLDNTSWEIGVGEYEAFRTLGQYGDVQVLATLMAHIANKLAGENSAEFKSFLNARIRYIPVVGDTLVAIGKREPQATALIVPYLESSNLTIRSVAIYVLVGIGGEKAIEALVPLMDSDDPSLREEAMNAIWAIGQPWGLGPLLRTLAEANPNSHKDMPGFSNGTDWLVDVVRRLKALHWQPLIKMERLLYDPERRWVINFALSEMETLLIIEILEAYIKDETLAYTERKSIFFISDSEPPQAIPLRALKGVEEILEQIGSTVNSKTLQRLTQLHDVAIFKYVASHGCVSDNYESSVNYESAGHVSLDCGIIRQLARQELMRRGIPV